MRNGHNGYGARIAVMESSAMGSERELREAARALVEAASWGYYARYGRFIGEETKSELVLAIVNNPLLIEQLFTKDGVNLH